MIDAVVIDAVVFDVGGVLCPSPLGAFDQVDAEHGLPAGTTMAVFRGGDVFAQCETGRMPLAEFSAECARQVEREHGIAIPDDRFARMLLGVMGGATTPENVALAAQVKAAGHRVALLTNIVAELRGWLHGLLPDGVVDVYGDSSELGLRKPNPEIYQRLLELLACPPEQVVFVDDFPENIATARELGIHTVLYENPEHLRGALAALGVRIPATA